MLLDQKLACSVAVQHTHPMKTLARSVNDLIGTFRSFGDEGPVYQVVSRINGERVHVLVVETGEELDYSVTEALNDPEAE